MTDNSNTYTECPEEMLPWFVNHTLTASQEQEVEAHLKHCRRCQQEVEWLRTVRREIKTTAVDPPGELGLKRLLNSIKHQQSAEQSRQKQRFAWRPIMAIAASLIIIVQAGLLIHSWFGPATITPLSKPPEQGLVLQVTFSPMATEEQIREIVQTVSGTFVGGPGALGVYRIRLEVPINDPNAIRQAVNHLRQKGKIVTHVAQE